MQNLRRSRGLTLIEILGALVILSTLFVGILVAKGRSIRQLYHAEEKAAAIELTDALVSKWWSNPAQFPRNKRGKIEGHENREWRTSIISNDQLRRLGAQQVRVELFDADSTHRVLVQLDVVLPDPDFVPPVPATMGGK
jgi:hypothetical protein